MTTELVNPSKDGRFLTFKGVLVKSNVPGMREVSYDITIEITKGVLPLPELQGNALAIRELASLIFAQCRDPEHTLFNYDSAADRSLYKKTIGSVEEQKLKPVRRIEDHFNMKKIWDTLFNPPELAADVRLPTPSTFDPFKESSFRQLENAAVKKLPTKASAPAFPAAPSKAAASESDVAEMLSPASGETDIFEEPAPSNAAPAAVEELAPAPVAAPTVKVKHFDIEPYRKDSNTFAAFDLAFKNFREESAEFAKRFSEGSYSDLVKYAEDVNKPETKKFLKKNPSYDAFVKLLNDPESKEQDAKLMRELLERLYAIAHHRYVADLLKPEHRDDEDRPETDAELREVSAATVVEFIPVEVSPKALVDCLVKISLPDFQAD